VTSRGLNYTRSLADAITVGPDGALWFIEANKIGRFTTSGVLTEYPVPSGDGLGITTGPDGALWFTEGGSSGKVGRISV